MYLCSQIVLTITAVCTLVLPSAGLNARGMRRVGSPYPVPVLFILLTVTGKLQYDGRSRSWSPCYRGQIQAGEKAVQLTPLDLATIR